MSAGDIRYGRGGGRIVPWSGGSVSLVRARCSCTDGDVVAWLVLPEDLGAGRCMRCGDLFRSAPPRTVRR